MISSTRRSVCLLRHS